MNAIEIFKHLPGGKKIENANCKKCGFPTCMAFAVKLASKNTQIEKCPFVSTELQQLFEEANIIQQHEINLGNDIKAGGETVMFRHEKTFVNPTCFYITLFSDDINFNSKLNEIANYQIERVGETFRIDGIYLIDKGNVKNAIEKIKAQKLNIILKTENIANEFENIDEIVVEANEFSNINKKNTIVVSSDNIETLSQKSDIVQKEGFKSLILKYENIEHKNIKKVVDDLTNIRFEAIENKNQSFAFPVMTRIVEQDINKVALIASLLICRYSNIIVFDVFDKSLFSGLFTLRQNIFTNPQKPLQVESKIYEINNPKENLDRAIVVMTTNFALTYFAVANELESLDTPFFLLITPSDGMSVLTAWSAEKFTADMVKKMVNENEILNGLRHKLIVIPGLLASMKEELEEILPNWKIIVGTNEAFEIPQFIEKLNSKLINV